MPKRFWVPTMMLLSGIAKAQSPEPDAALRPGRPEFRLLVGAGTDSEVPQGIRIFAPQTTNRPYSITAGGAVGVRRWLAVTGDLSRHRLSGLRGICLFGGSECGQTSVRRQIDEVTGGFRLSPSSGRWGAFVSSGAGVAHWRSTSTASSLVVNNRSAWTPAIFAGGGFNRAFRSRYGIVFELRALAFPAAPGYLGTNLRDSRAPRWMVRMGAGLFVRP